MEKEIIEEEVDKFDNSEFDSIPLDDITKIYLKEISRYPVLSAEQQKNLLKKYKEENDQESFKKLVNHNLRLSAYVAKKYINKCKSMKLLDLI